MSFDHKAVGPVKTRVTGPEAMVETIMEMGLVPFFENVIPGYSIEEMTPKENWFDTQEDLTYTPWDWKIACVQSGEIAYGKFLLGGKAAFATVKWYAHLRNWRQAQAKYKPDATQRKVLDAMQEQGSIGIKDIRKLLDVKKGAADALMTKLQMQCRVLTGDIIRVYRGPDLHYNGWQTSSFCSPEALFDTAPPFPGFAGFPFEQESLEVTESPQESWDLLCEHVRSLFPDVTDKQLKQLLG